MPNPPPDWSLYRSFIAVLREGSLSAAARTLKLGQSTLSRHISALEAALEVTLFTRSQEGLVPTSAALALQPEAEALAAAAAALELAVSNRIDDLIRREADIAVRVAPPSQAALLAQRVGEIEVGLFAHPAYLARRDAPVSVAGLFAHSLIGFDAGAAYTRTLQLDGQALTREQFSLRTDCDLAQLAMIRAGFGIGACHAALAQRSGLIRILPGHFQPRVPAWVVMHENLRSTARYRTVFDALVDGMRGYLGTAD
ncbi:LysR family transcriptional regulator [Jeongeupia sp. HS-3]|uniref:LysR family transcriptional regulator n=1 Tax=Jeongeupia sp. HS-3 TaxID=1009682 RepID=UPI0018A3B5C6|nr:LysR family transcriptional regulator [Jeongeupia sp. HS-3]BCL77040.1 LysR family transcriptional regulator [Jeongeupia sp. HS-3]